MAIVNLPKLGAVNFRDDLTQEQFNAELDRLSKKYDFELPRPEFGLGEIAKRGIVRGVKQLGSTFGDVIPAMVASNIGLGAYAKEQMDEAAETQADIEANYAPMYRGTQDVRGISDIPGFVLETVTEQAPNIATSFIPGAGLGAAGARTAAGALAKRAVTRELGEEATKRYIAQNLAKATAGRQATGQAVGVYLGSYAQNTPEIFQNIYESTGQMEPGVAALFGTVSSALDAVLPATILKGMSPSLKLGVTEKILERSGMKPGLLRKTLAGTTTGAGFEGLTESAQEGISIAAEKFVSDNDAIWDSKDFNRMVQAGVKGAVAGGAFGAGGAGAQQAAEGRRRREQYQAALEKRADRVRKGEISKSEAEMEAMQEVDAQGTFPDMEAPVASGFTEAELTKQQEAELRRRYPELANATSEQLKELKGTQLSLFDETGAPTKGAAKSVAAGERLAKQQEQAAKKEAAEAEKKRKAELAQYNKEFKEAKEALEKNVLSLAPIGKLNLVNLAKGVEAAPGASQLEQLIAKANLDLEKIAARRGVSKKEAAEKLVSGEITPAADEVVAPAEEAVTEPMIVPKKGPVDPKELPTVVNDDVLKNLGIGPTGKIRKNKVLDGKDISDPAQAAEVKAALEAYANGKTLSTSIRQKVEAYLSRPEFQFQTEEAINEQPVGTPIAGTDQPSVSDIGQGRAPSFAETIGEPLAEGLATTEQAVDTSGVREESIDRPLGVKEQADVAKAEQNVAVAEEEQADFITANESRANDLITADMREAANKQGIPESELPAEDFSQTDAFKFYRLPALFQEFFRLQDVIGLPAKTAVDLAQRARNQQELQLVQEAIGRSGPEATAILRNLSGIPDTSRQNYLAQINKAGRDASIALANERIAAAKKRIAESKQTEAIAKEEQKVQAKQIAERRAPETLTAEEKEIEDLANIVAEKFNKITGKKFFLPAFRGAEFDATAKSLAEAGDLNGLITHLFKTNKSKDVKQILNKIKGLNLKTKIEIGDPTGEFNLIAANKNWFSGSEITNPDGTPKVMYHGTVADIDTFIPNDLGLIFVSPSKKAANEFAATAGARRKVDNVKVGANVIPVYAKSVEPWDYQNPRHVAILARNLIGWYGSEKNAVDVLSSGHFEDLENQRVIDTIKELGFDGMYINEFGKQAGAEYKNLAVFNSDQLQSAISGYMFAENKAGSYDPTTNIITLSPEFGLNEHTVIHELVHAAISHVLNNKNHPLTKELTKLFESIANQLGGAYGAQDVQEFAAELVGNPQFQAQLKLIKAPRGGNMFQRMVQAVAEFFGFRKGTSAYEAGLKTINDIIDISSNVESTPADKMFLGVGQAVNQAFNVVGEIGKNMPALTGSTIDSVKNTLSNVKGRGLLDAAMSVMRLDHLNKLYGKELPSIQKLLDALELRAGEQENRIKAINDNYDRFVKAVKANPEQAKKMDDMAIDARLAGVDPLDANFKTTPSNVQEYNRLRAVYNQLPKSLQEVYSTIRKDYEASLNEYEKLILSAVSPSLKARLQQEFATKKRLTAYVPFLRRGDFWVEYADPASNERAAHAFESIRERDAFIAELNKQKIQHRSYENLQDIRFNQNQVPPTSFIGKIIKDLQASGASQEQLDNVYQSYLTLFPGESIFKQFMKAQNVRGMERDIVRGYGDTMIKWARKITNSKYSPAIDTAVDEIKAQAETANQPQVTAAAQNIVDQRDFFHNPTFGKFTHAATAFSYFEYIAGNISSALINVTSLPMLVWPTLGAKFGFDKAGAAMANASKVAINGMEKDKKYKNLYDAMMDHAQLKHTMAREVLEGRRATTQEFTGLKARILDGLSIPFAATERYNRATTAIAAYDLAKAKGMSEAEAIRYAVDTVKDLHTSGMAATAPKLFQTAPGRVFFTFKSYVWNSAFVMARAFHQAFKGESPEVRREARRQLLGVYGMTMAFAGAKGLPFYGAVKTLSTMISALFGDDDEPYDFDEDMRGFFGELGYKGAFNYLTNVEISNRVGIATDLVFRDDPRGVAEHGYVLSAMQQAFGPAGSYLINAERSIKAMNEGHVERALEGLAPSFVRNAMKGTRYLAEGATTLKGDPIQDDVSAYNSLMQAFGFAPADLSSTYEKTSARKGYEREVLARHTKLLNLYDMARTSGDYELMGDVQSKINDFNAAHPGKAITGQTLQKSYTERRRREREMVDGISYNRKLKPEIMAKFE